MPDSAEPIVLRAPGELGAHQGSLSGVCIDFDIGQAPQHLRNRDFAGAIFLSPQDFVAPRPEKLGGAEFRSSVSIIRPANCC